jgi:hypothetical protein
VGSLVITAAVKDYIAAHAARQAFFRFANAALWVQGHLHRSPILPDSAFLRRGVYAIHVGHVRCL